MEGLAVGDPAIFGGGLGVLEAGAGPRGLRAGERGLLALPLRARAVRARRVRSPQCARLHVVARAHGGAGHERTRAVAVALSAARARAASAAVAHAPSTIASAPPSRAR